MNLPQESESLDLVGEPFAVIESDPGVFTTLLRKLGVEGLSVVELYSVEPYETDHLNPYGLIFCYLCDDGADTAKDLDPSEDFDDPDARSIWFANQLSDDACASQAILNVLLNCKNVRLGAYLKEFAADTEAMSPVMRGLAISNLPLIREAQNSLARPSDVRGAWHALVSSALESAKSKAKAAASPPAKKRRTTSASSRSRHKSAASARGEEKLDAYHYVGYVPAHGRVWELNGLRAAGPLDVGEIDSDNPESRAGWMDIVRPVLQRRMQTVMQSGAEHIQYNLLAIVDDPYLKASDELELLKRERAAIERRLAQSFPEGWSDKVDPELLASAAEAFATTLRPHGQTPGKVFSPDFGARKMEKELAILDMPERKLVPAWEACVGAALLAKIAVEDDIEKSRQAQADHIRRTFDYEPFIREFITSLNHQGLLDGVLEDKPDARAETTQSAPGPSSKPRAKTKRR